MTAAEDPWLRCHRWALQVAEGGAVSDWSFDLGDGGGDLRLRVHEHGPKGERRGELVIVCGRALAIHDLEGVPQGRELEEVDAPGLVLQLTRAVLQRLVPAGPEKVVGSLSVEQEESSMALTAATMSASGRMDAPWHAVANLRRDDGDTVSFELALRYCVGTPEQSELRVSGSCMMSAPTLVLDDSMSLAGWRVFFLGPRREERTLDFGTRPEPRVGTVGDLRRTLSGA